MDSERKDIARSIDRSHSVRHGFDNEIARLRRLDDATRNGMSLRSKALLVVGGFMTIGAALVFVDSQCTDLRSGLEAFGGQTANEAGLVPSPSFSALEGAVPEKVVTQNWGTVRKDSVMEDDVILGYAKPGQVTDGIEGTGAVYISGEGYKVLRDGYMEGVWYKVSEVQLFSEKDGKFVQMTDENGNPVYAHDAVIAAPFIRHATSEDLQGSHSAQPKS